MGLPNRENAYIPPPKLNRYLLLETHPLGKEKARLLRSAGFDETNANVLEQGLLAIARSQQVTEAISSPYGKKFIIEGVLQTPIGRLLQLRTVWIIDTGQNRPRFVTAYPI